MLQLKRLCIMRCSSEMMWGEIAQTFGESWVRGTICGTEDRCMWSHALGWKNVGTAAVGVGEKALSCTCSPGAETQKIFSLRLEDMGQNSFPRQAPRAEPLARSRANQTCGPDRTKAWGALRVICTDPREGTASACASSSRWRPSRLPRFTSRIEGTGLEFPIVG